MTRQNKQAKVNKNVCQHAFYEEKKNGNKVSINASIRTYRSSQNYQEDLISDVHTTLNKLFHLETTKRTSLVISTLRLISWTVGM